VSYQVIARKWRPQSFQDLVGQEHVSQTLLNALRHDRLPQALLFTGVRGTGKTSSARILAKSLRCPNAKDFVPCGVCSECEDVANSRSLDVIEIDGASNNGVDAIRELRETVGYMPSSGRYKVYIIDEVHMLSTSAFNALLKTLEEPPAHVVFIMATTEAQKIPSTILSRCQRFDFRRIPSRQIASQLAKICEAEGVKTEGEALWLLARQADGSMRDSQSLLDQVITFCGGEVTLQKVIDVLGLTDRSLLLETLESLVRRDTQKAVDVIEKIFKSGYDPKVFAQDLLEEIRNALLVRLSPDDPSRVVDLPDTEIESLRELTASLTDEDLHLLFDMTLKGVNDLLRSQDARIVLEMLLLRMAAAPRIASLAALASGQAVFQPAPAVSTQSNEEPQAPASAAAKPQYSMASFTRPASGISGAPATPVAAAKTSQPAPSAAPAATAPPSPAPAQQQAPAEPDEPSRAVDAAKANDPWYRFVERVKKANSLLGAMLENTHLISAEGSQLTIGVPKKMSFMFDKVKDPENISRIQTFLETFWNKKYDVQVKLADEKADKATPKSMADEHRQAQKRSVEQAVEQNPLVQTAQNVFKAQIKSIKDAGPQGAAKSGADGQAGKTSTKRETT
jgi:DNA polymerase III subunit gamma/tau